MLQPDIQQTFWRSLTILASLKPGKSFSCLAKGKSGNLSEIDNKIPHPSLPTLQLYVVGATATAITLMIGIFTEFTDR